MSILELVVSDTEYDRLWLFMYADQIHHLHLRVLNRWACSPRPLNSDRELRLDAHINLSQ